MKKHLCLICTVMSVVLTALLSGCNDGNLSETSSALTFSELTSSIFVNSDNTSSENASSKVETSSKTSSTQKEETSSSNSTSTTSKISVDRTPTSQDSSNISSNVSSDKPKPIKKFLTFDVYEEHTDLNQIITNTYKENEISKEILNQYQNIGDLNRVYPIQCVLDCTKYYVVCYRQELYIDDYGTATVFFKAYYDSKGNQYAKSGVVQATYTKAQFEENLLGKTLKDVLEKYPDSLAQYGDYPWGKSDMYYPVSLHRTTDGYDLYVEYEIPEEDKALWKEIRDNNGKGLTIELYYRWIVKKVTAY